MTRTGNIRWDAKTTEKIIKQTGKYFDFPQKLKGKKPTKYQKEKLRKALFTANWIEAKRRDGSTVVSLRAGRVARELFGGQTTDRGRFFVRLPPSPGTPLERFKVRSNDSEILMFNCHEVRKFITVNSFELLSDTVGYITRLIKENRGYKKFSFIVNGFISDRFHEFTLETFLYILYEYKNDAAKFFNGLVLFKPSKQCRKTKSKLTTTAKKQSVKTAKKSKRLKRK